MKSTNSNGRQDGVGPVAAEVRSRLPVNVSLNGNRAVLDGELRLRSRVVVPFNQGWEFLRWENAVGGEADGDGALPTFDGAAWETVNVPHSVRLEPRNASGCRNYQGVCWYRKTFYLDERLRQRTVYLEFEGMMQLAEVWLNGRKLATHACGYTPLVLDVSEAANFSETENCLVVRLDNSDNPQVPPGKRQRKLDFTYFGGMYRNVHLRSLDRLHVSDAVLADCVAGGGVFVTCPSVTAQSATVSVQTDVRNQYPQIKQCRVRHELVGDDGRVVARCSDEERIAAGGVGRFRQSMEVERPALWHPHHPHLYSLRTVVCDGDEAVDEVVTQIGIRHIRFDKDDGLFINGEKFFSLGANRHQDHPYVGYALPDSAHWRDVKKLREAGFTSFRSHYPQAPAFMDACDRLGMLTIVSNPGWQFVGDEVFTSRAIQNARTMVRRDRNRASVVLWEGALNESDNKELGAALQQAIHEEYPGDQCYTAGDREDGFSWGGVPSWDVDFLHNDGSKPYWIREWGDQVDNWSDQQSSNRVARGWGEAAMLTQAWSHLTRLEEILVGHSGSLSGGRLAGACLWAGIDHQRGYHHNPFFGGVMDMFRIPKFDYYMFQSQRPPGVHVPGLADGPMVFVANYATFFSPTAITVFSNCEEVRLLRDGREIARQGPDRDHRMAHPPFTFRIEKLLDERTTMYMTGAGTSESKPVELRAEGIIGGKVVASHVVRPPGVATRLELEADLCEKELVGDGADWVRVYARVCDVHGTVCPLADDLVRFGVEGEGEIIGGAEIGANPVCAEAGIATALLRATTRAGKIVVRASAFGLTVAELQLTSHAPCVTGLVVEFREACAKV